MNNISLESSTKITQDSRKIQILRLKTVTASGTPSGHQTSGLQTNVSANQTNFEEQICQNAQKLYIEINILCT